MRSSATMLALVAVIAVLPARAHAQGAGKQAAAQSLFDEAKKLMAKGDLGAACPKFADSQKLDPAAGTEFNLANCYEKNGQTASAWATFKSAASAYRQQNRTDWEQKARERATQLEPKLARLTVVVPPENAVPGLEVKRDGQPLSPSELGAAIPVDPGEHPIDASAPGKKPWSSTARVAAGPGETKVAVGPLEAATAGAPATVATTAPPAVTPASTSTSPANDDIPRESSSQKTIGYVVLGVGAVGLAVGTITGVMALSKNKSSTDQCPNDGACSSKDAVDANDSAKSLATVSTVGFIVGGVGVAAGAILLLTAPKGPAKTGSVRVIPTVGAGSAGLTALGVF